MEDKDLKTAQPEEQQNNSYDATLEEDIPQMSDEELQESILEDSDLNGFQKWVARADDAKWKLYQRLLGIVMGLGAGAALFWETISPKQVEAGAEKGFSYSLIIAVVIALLIPNIIEKQGKRKIPVARITMAITLGVVLVAYFIWAAANGTFKG